MKIKKRIAALLHKLAGRLDPNGSKFNIPTNAHLPISVTEWRPQRVECKMLVNPFDIEKGKRNNIDVIGMTKDEVRHKLANEIARHIEVTEEPDMFSSLSHNGIVLTATIQILVKK